MAELKTIKMDVYDLKVGLYVATLDRPWSQTSFPLQGFSIRSSRELNALRSVCQYVYIDTQKSKFESDEDRNFVISKSTDKTGKKDNVRKSAKPIQVDHEFYQRKNDIPSATEMARSTEDLKRISESLQSIYKDLKAGSNIDEQSLSGASEMLTDAVVKTPSASFWAALLQEHDDKIYNHGLRSATWALICARHIGLEQLQMQRMAQGILLKDVYRLSSKFRGSAGKDPVLTSISMLRESGAHPKVVAVVKYHRERFNGTGKPFGLIGEKIPFLARIASVAIAYDLALHPLKEGAVGKSPSEAAKLLYNQKGRSFQEELVVEFIEAIGLYPLGTLVELSTGETAIVVKHNPARRLKPEVLIIRDEAGNQINTEATIDLANAQDIAIKRDLPNAIQDNRIQEIFESAVINLANADKDNSGGFMKRLFG